MLMLLIALALEICEREVSCEFIADLESKPGKKKII